MRPQPLIAVHAVARSSRWYQTLLGCKSDHGGDAYERLVARDGTLVMQLHAFDEEHHHDAIGDPANRPYGNGVLLWFEIEDFDAALARARKLGAEVVRGPERNPPDGSGGPNHRELWLRDLDGYTVVLASPDGEAAPDARFMQLVHALADDDSKAALHLLRTVPILALDCVQRDEEQFVAALHHQLYAGDTALHVAAAAYDVRVVRALLAADASVKATNRRGNQPLHYAVDGAPDSPTWDPRAQTATIEALIAAGADPNAPAEGGTTPLGRAVRNRCSAAVAALLRAGADPTIANSRGSTPLALAALTTGRGGSGSPAAKAEQAHILRLLRPSRPLRR